MEAVNDSTKASVASVNLPSQSFVFLSVNEPVLSVESADYSSKGSTTGIITVMSINLQLL